MFLEREFTFDRVIRLVLGAAILTALIYLLGVLRDVLTPFALAVLLAYMLNPLVVRIQRVVSNRKAAVTLSLLLVVTIATMAIWLLAPILAREFSGLGALFRQVTARPLPTWLSELLPADLWTRIVQWTSEPDFQEIFSAERLWHLVEAGAQKALPRAWQLLHGAAGFLLGLLGLLVVGFYLVFLLVDFDSFTSSWPALIPDAYRERTMEFLHEFADGMRRYFRGQSAIAAMVGILFAIGFWLIGLPMGILLGLFIGLLNMIPYMQIIGVVPALLLAVLNAWVTGGHIWVALGLCLLVFAVVQTIQDMVLVPRILGRSLGMNPVAILLSLSIWGRLLGTLGLLIALPMTCLLLAYYRRYWIPMRPHATPATSAAPPPAPSEPPRPGGG